MARNRKVVDYTVGLEEGLNMFDDAEMRALERLEEDGLGVLDSRPRESDGTYFDGRVPANLSSMAPKEIGEYYNLMVTYTDYVAGRAILAKVGLSSSQEKLKLVKAKVRKAKAGTVKEKDDDVQLDSRYVEALANVQEYETYYSIAHANEESARRNLRFISRIIETKKMELEQGARSSNIRGNQAFRPQRRRKT